MWDVTNCRSLPWHCQNVVKCSSGNVVDSWHPWHLLKAHAQCWHGQPRAVGYIVGYVGYMGNCLMKHYRMAPSGTIVWPVPNADTGFQRLGTRSS